MSIDRANHRSHKLSRLHPGFVEPQEVEPHMLLFPQHFGCKGPSISTGTSPANGFKTPTCVPLEEGHRGNSRFFISLVQFIRAHEARNVPSTIKPAPSLVESTRQPCSLPSPCFLPSSSRPPSSWAVSFLPPFLFRVRFLCEYQLHMHERFAHAPRRQC